MTRSTYFDEPFYGEDDPSPFVHTRPRPPGSPPGAPYHQNVYDLFDVVRRDHLPHAAARIAEWEGRTGLRFPAALAEFYTTAVTLRSGGSEPRDWTLPLVELWSEYSNDERARPLEAVLQQTDRPERADEVGAAGPGPYLWVMTENQGVWLLQARLDGSDDPVVYADEPTFLSPPEAQVWAEEEPEAAWVWHPVGRFTDVLFGWLSRYYAANFTPLSFRSAYRRTGFPAVDAPPTRYANGLWLRSAAHPLAVPLLDYLTDRFGEPDRDAPSAGLLTRTHRPSGGVVRLTVADPPSDGSPAALWARAGSPEELAAIAGPLYRWGPLRDTLVADTAEARAALAGIAG